MDLRIIATEEEMTALIAVLAEAYTISGMTCYPAKEPGKDRYYLKLEEKDTR